LGVKLLEVNHTSENLMKPLKHICFECEIDLSKVNCLVTENRGNIGKGAKQLFGKNKHFACFAHTLNLVATNATPGIAALKNIIEKVKLIVAFFWHGVTVSDELKKTQDQTVQCQT
jgi:hypothetical protein